MNRIDKRFSRLAKEGRKAFITYIMAGDPDLAATMDRVLMLEACGADIIELGVPFSDPIADGPAIQHAAGRALASGTTLRKIVHFVKDLRARTQIPVVLMTYYNPILKYGEEAFIADAAASGVDGLIIPDLPVEEADTLIRQCRKMDVATIFLAAPTSSTERMKRIADASRGFIYYVSMTGITGSRLSLSGEFGEHIAKLQALSKKPICIGFGVSTPEDARRVASCADGVIVGSAIVKKLQDDPGSARDFIEKLREAV